MRYRASVPAPCRYSSLGLSALATVCLAAASCGVSHGPVDPGLVWASPVAISYGTALSSTQLSATTSAPGTLTYTPAIGTVLPAGNHELAVTFTPEDSASFQSATATVTLTVNKAAPTVIWIAPAPITYGTPLDGSQLDANSGAVKGTFCYTPGPGSMLAAGDQTLSATFTPADGANYQATTLTVQLTVNKMPPVIYWPKPSPIISGTALSGMQLDAIANGIGGKFTYTPASGTILPPGTQTLMETFTPHDSQNYGIVTTTQTLTISDAPPSITAQPQDESVTVGQAAAFSVSATGTSPLSYQWMRNSIPIQGATAETYVTPVVTATESGSYYSVVVSDLVHVTSSARARLDVSIPSASSYYVSVHGNDQNDGSATAPFATLYRAQSAMQKSLTKVTQIQSGTYYLSSPLTLTEADQGETWEAAQGANVILSGGEVIAGWQSEGNGVYSAQVSQAVGLDLSVSGVRQVPAARGYDPDRPYTSGWRLMIPGQSQGYNTTFAVLPTDLTASAKPGAIVQVIDHNQWCDTLTKIVSVNAEASTITVATAIDTGSSGGLAGSWRVLNDPADISVPGQFAYEPVSSRAFVKPGSSGMLQNSDVVAAQLGALIIIRDSADITIRSLTFADTISDTIDSTSVSNASQAAIMATNLSGGIISGNRFLNVGEGIALRGSSSNLITGNSFEKCGVSGISLLSNSNHNTITYNVLLDIGQIHVGSYGVSINDSSFNLVDSNLIDGAGRWGIVFGPSGEVSDMGFANSGNVFSNNVIRNTSNRTNDSGAIYGGAQTFNGYLNEGLLITGNRIENVGGLVRSVSGEYAAGFAQGIYLDDHLSGVTVANNVVESGGMYGMILCHGCSGNSATNNVIVQQPAPIYDRGEYGAAFATGDMVNNGTTRIDLLPSYFPWNRTTATIVVQASGSGAGAAGAAFSLQVDGVVVGTGTASQAVSDFVFKAAVSPHQTHRIGVSLTNGTDVGPSTTELHNLGLIINNTAVSLSAAEAKGNYGTYGFAAIPDDRMVTNFSVSRNIVYRNGGLSQDEFDLTPAEYPGYLDANPGIIDFNLLYQNVVRASDGIFGGRLLDADSVGADPGFANPAVGDYRIQVGSPAYGVGFNTNGVPLMLLSPPWPQ